MLDTVVSIGIPELISSDLQVNPLEIRLPTYNVILAILNLNTETHKLVEHRPASTMMCF